MLNVDFQVSVIIPVYNAEKYLRKAVASAVLIEEVGEVILIEDKSPDNALDLCHALVAEYDKVTLFQHPDKGNHGAGASRNLGIEKASCTYISFLDADDYYLPSRFIKDKEVFESREDCEGVYNAVGTHFYSQEAKQDFYDKGFAYQETLTLSGAVGPDELFSVLFSRHPHVKGEFHTNGITLKKTVFNKVGVFHTKLRLRQDIHLWRRLAGFCNLYAGELSEPVAIRVIHASNRMTNTQDHYQYFEVWWRSLKDEFRKNRLHKAKLDIFEQAYYNHYSASPNKLKAITSLLSNTIKKPKIIIESNGFFDFNFWRVFGKNKFSVHIISAKNMAIMYGRKKYQRANQLSKSKIYITKKFKSFHPIIPLGCDCHAAYLLDKMALRKKSYPFDWLNTQPLVGFNYINTQIETKFKNFLQHLEVNTRGHVISNHYPTTEFMHNYDLIQNGTSFNMLSRRAKRFLDDYQTKKQHFLYGLPLKALSSEKNVDNFKNSILEFIEKLYSSQLVYIYLTYEENPGDLTYYKYLNQSCNSAQVRFVLFERKISQGPWGNEKEYPKLIEKFKIKGYYYPSYKIVN